MLEANGDAIRRYGVRSLGLFGSAARGTARPESDLDFVVEFDRKSFDAYMALKLFLEQNKIIVEPKSLALWAVPTAVTALVVHCTRLAWLDRRLRREFQARSQAAASPKSGDGA